MTEEPPNVSLIKVGGGAAFAEHILPTVTANGGEARAGVRVAELLIEGGRAVGIKTSDGEQIRADVIISNIGARETVNHLLPRPRAMLDSGRW